jgi:hypothetical protein
MKITKSQLKQFIKEEIQKLLNEQKSKLPFPLAPEAGAGVRNPEISGGGLNWPTSAALYNLQRRKPQWMTNRMADVSKDAEMVGGDIPTPEFEDPRKFEPEHTIINPDTGEEIENPYAVDPAGMMDKHYADLRKSLEDPDDASQIKINYFNPDWARAYDEHGGEVAKTWTLPSTDHEFRRSYGKPWLTKSTKSLEDALTMLDKSNRNMPKTHQTTVKIGDSEMTREDLVRAMGRDRYKMYASKHRKSLRARGRRRPGADPGR